MKNSVYFNSKINYLVSKIHNMMEIDMLYLSRILEKINNNNMLSKKDFETIEKLYKEN